LHQTRGFASLERTDAVPCVNKRRIPAQGRDDERLSRVYRCRRTPSREQTTDARFFFAAAYAACAVLAFAASRARARGAAARTGPFWLRIAILCAVFAVLRSVDANIAVSHAIRGFSHSEGLRPGPYLMVLAAVAFTAAVAGLLLFPGRSLHPAVGGAAIVIILLMLLALAQSVSLYRPILILQAMIGPVTVSRIIEAVLLIMLALCTIWFVRDPNSGEAVLLEE
jgi:hypothetical protein